MRLSPPINAEDRWVIVSVALTLSGIILGARLAEPRAFGITALIVIALLFVAFSVTHSPRLSWLLLFGLVAGVMELWADWLHVVYFHSLVYTDYFGFQLLASPSYMPIGWWLTVVQFGYIALRLADRWPAWAAVGIPTALGMTLPPWYEEFAPSARAWYYPPHGVMLSHTPLWIIFTYGGCYVRHCVLCCAVISTAGLGPSVDSWPIHRRRHYVLGRNMVCFAGSSRRLSRSCRSLASCLRANLLIPGIGLLKEKRSSWAGCWAHTRRAFYEALDHAPKEAAWISIQVGRSSTDKKEVSLRT